MLLNLHGEWHRVVLLLEERWVHCVAPSQLWLFLNNLRLALIIVIISVTCTLTPWGLLPRSKHHTCLSSNHLRNLTTCPHRCCIDQTEGLANQTMHTVLPCLPVLISSRHLKLDRLIEDNHQLLNPMLEGWDCNFSLPNVKRCNRIL